MAGPLEHLGQHRGDLGLVVNDEDGLRGHRRRRHGRRGLNCRCRRRDHGQLDAEFRPAPRLALDRDRPAVLLDDPLAEREAESRPLPARLRREEGLEDPRPDLGRNPRPGVADLEPHPVPLAVEPCRDREPARRRHGAHRVLGIHDEVHQHLVESVGIRPEDGQVLGEVEDDLHVARPQLVAEKLDRLPNHVVESDLAALGRVLAREGKEVADDADAAIGGGVNLLGALHEGAARLTLSKEVGLTDDHRERVVQLVGDARQERAHRREFLGLNELLGALAYDLLEALVVTRELLMEQACLEEVADPEKHLDLIERLGQEVLRAALECPALRLHRDVGRQHEDREIGLRWHQRLDLLEDLEPVHVGHREVEQDEVGTGLRVEWQRLARVGRGSQVGIALTLEHPLEEPHVGGLVVDDQDSGGLEGLLIHETIPLLPLFSLRSGQ